MEMNELQSELTITTIQLSNKYMDPMDPVPEGYKKAIHGFSTKIIPENEPVAFTPYYSYTTNQPNYSFNKNIK